jgi:diguanylate cyclase (GGDEF)-like protein
MMTAPAFLGALARGLDCALQPIVDANDGTLYGVEALLRGHEALGFATPIDLLDQAKELGVLAEVERQAQRLAVAKFATLPAAARRRLFVNLDGRTPGEPAITLLERTVDELARHGLPASALCVELSERCAGAGDSARGAVALRRQGLRFAADDFGQGVAELRLLHDGCLDYVKIDRLFIDGLASDGRKRLLVAQVVALAHGLGLRVVAEGLEREADVLACRDLGCDMLQGWFVAHPSTDAGSLRSHYPHIAETMARDRRRPRREGDVELILGAIERIPPVPEDGDIELVFELFRKRPELMAAPVVDAMGEPRGVVQERDLRPFIYGRYGRDLLRNRGTDPRVRAFTRPCPIADLHTAAEGLLEIFVAAPRSDGVLLSDRGQYVGMVGAGALLNLLQEKRLRQAIDQNPLTRLPGNLSVVEHASRAAAPAERSRHLCYFDFDHFKSFNDRHGFRQGDRMIMLFADALRRHFPAGADTFLGHIGGDDFFAGFCGMERTALAARLRALLDEMASSAALLYDPAERAAGGILAKDRDGRLRHIPLVRCSAAVLELPAGQGACDPDQVFATVTRLKGEAKAAPDGMAWSVCREKVEG